jgi:MFS superfamily sulfate permease-like transporter
MPAEEWVGVAVGGAGGEQKVCRLPAPGQVPIAALVGVMLLVCQSTFSWSSLRVMRKIPRADALVIVLVSAVTVTQNLAKV